MKRNQQKRGQRSRRETMCGGVEVKREGEEWPVPKKTVGMDGWK